MHLLPIRKYCEWRYVNRRPDRSTQCTNYNVYSKSATNENYGMDNYYPAEYKDNYYISTS